MSAELQNIKGLDKLREALLELPKGIAKNVLRGSVNAGASVIRNEAKSRAPVYTGTVGKDHPPPGTLKRAIYQKQIRERSGNEQQTFFVGVRRGKSAKKSKFDAYYAHMVEFGTSKMSARPFMRPAFEAKKQESVSAIRDYIAKRIPEEVEKARRK